MEWRERYMFESYVYCTILGQCGINGVECDVTSDPISFVTSIDLRVVDRGITHHTYDYNDFI